MAKVYATPGVYIEERSAFASSAVPVATAVPAFIGYTEKAIRGRTDIRNVPTKISSFSEFNLYFGGAPPTKFNIAKSDDANVVYTVAPEGSRFYLYHSIKLFFANGGSDCYIVSVGNYANGLKKEDFGADGVETDPVLTGIATLLKEPEPTMLVIPDLVSLSQADCASLQLAMLQHCGEKTKSRFAILDVYGGNAKTFQGTLPDGKEGEVNAIENFRNSVGTNFLQWGAAYYPWVNTSITAANSVDFTSITPASTAVMIEILKADLPADADPAKPDPRTKLISEKIDLLTTLNVAADAATKPSADDVQTLHQTLLAVVPIYKAIMTSVLDQINLLPPSAAMAGIYSMVDNNIGVFQSPANISVGSVTRPAINITQKEQEDLNLPLNGKAVNAIRTFPGKGILVWGARTLDGNSQDWRYISVRRTVIFIEQSIKYAAEPYVFSPNTAVTWTNLKAVLNNFLTNVWQQGALAGATPEDAFNVDIGLGVTMTPIDILEGYMKITVRIAVTRPAEFIVITFEQKMQQS